jgi:NAD(P)-dependent dehydrogenase (short-subunit alcohol dehydrogenase family)
MRRVLVTGANRGLGLELVRQQLARGDRVIATARKPGQAHELTRLALANPGRLHILPLDTARPATVTELVKELALVTDALDTLVNNAGMLVSGEAFGALEAKNLQDTFATNVVGATLLTQAATPLLEKGDAPRVLNISSILGSLALRDSFCTPSYCISKAALNMVTRLLAPELAGRGIVLACANPGWVKTDMGGSGAELAIGDAVRDLLAILDGLTPAQSGQFLAAGGKTLPW